MLHDPSFTYLWRKINLGSRWFQFLTRSSTIPSFLIILEEVDENDESEYEFPTSMTEMILWLVGACLFGAFVLAPLLDYLLY
tara:strand:- start:4 stop:249 length:246 start_codon:yes stop_codon:yes gene_type:complete